MTETKAVCHGCKAAGGDGKDPAAVRTVSTKSLLLTRGQRAETIACDAALSAYKNGVWLSQPDFREEVVGQIMVHTAAWKAFLTENKGKVVVVDEKDESGATIRASAAISELILAGYFDIRDDDEGRATLRLNKRGARYAKKVVRGYDLVDFIGGIVLNIIFSAMFLAIIGYWVKPI